jgi:hypothetical protein
MRGLPDSVYNSRPAFNGAPTDRATWMLAGGAAMVVAGLAGLMRGFRKG